MSDDDLHACDCGATFDTLEELKRHAAENHPDAYEENVEDWPATAASREPNSWACGPSTVVWT